MPAVLTQQLAFIADLDLGDPKSAMVRALAMFDSETKNTHLRRASAHVLSKYAKRFHRAAGSSFTLATWGDLTKGMVCDIARFTLLSARGFDPAAPADAVIKEQAEKAYETLNEIADITNKNAAIDPDAVGTVDADEEGALASSEGGVFDEADSWARYPGGTPSQIRRTFG